MKALTVILLFAAAAATGAEQTLISFRPGSSTQVKAVSVALTFVGTPYSFGGASSAGMDCSGLVYTVYKDLFARALPRTVRELYAVGDEVRGELAAGDLVFFDTTGELPSHVGVYTGDGYFVHAASEGPQTGVILSALGEQYYRERYAGARRLLEWGMPAFSIRLGDQPGVYRHPRPLGEGAVRIEVSSAAQGVYRGEVKKNGEFFLGKRVALAPESPGELWFKPSEGDYTVDVIASDGRRVAELVFAVH